MNFLCALYANAERTSAEAQTSDAGSVVVSQADTPGDWAALIASGIAVAEFPGNLPAGKRAALKDSITAYRWQVETGGIALADGTPVKTQIEDQNRISNAVSNALRIGMTSVSFKNADDEFVSMPVSVLVAVADAVALHVQACFDAEGAHYKTIDGLADADLDTYDITNDWPAATAPQEN